MANTEAAATNALAITQAVAEKIASLEKELQEAIRADHESEMATLCGQLHQLTDGVRVLEHWFMVAWTSAQLGDLELLARGMPRTSSTFSRGCMSWVTGWGDSTSLFGRS